MKKVYSLGFSILLFPFISFAQSPQAGIRTNWVARDLFEQKVFIENKGQFPNEVRYAWSGLGLDIYFSNKGITWKHEEHEKINRDEREKAERGDEKIPEARTQTVQMEWQGASPSVQIVAEDIQSQYFTYPSPDDNARVPGIKAAAYKKIIYKNVYPNIDVEYYFPNGKEGFKYDIIVHPSGDASMVKMKYSGYEKLLLENNNLVIRTPFGDIVDHEPVAYFREMNDPIPASSFVLNDNMVSFRVQASSPVMTTVIDPWVTNPNFPTYNAAYDVEFDYAGNVYVHGGYQPYKEIKLNSSGTILWTFNVALFTVAGYYGDFCVDPASQSSYIVEAYRCCNQGTRAYKVNPSGVQSGFFNGNNMMQEFWRCQFDNCNRKVVVVGSSFVYANNYQACILDTNLTAITPVNVLQGSSFFLNEQDMCLLTLDNFGNAFMADCGNKFLKCPVNTLAPTAYLLPDNHPFTELNSIAYVKNYVPSAIGMNGMAASKNNVYTYDGKLIQRWRKNNGTLQASSTISSTPFRWGGLSTDDCDHLFAGNQNSVIQYDSTFAVVNTIAMNANTDTVYDVRLAPGNMLYVCGYGFAASYSVNLPACTVPLSVNITSSGNCSSGSATASVSGGSGTYAYLWTPSNQTTQTATGLSSGTYTVTVTDNAYCTPVMQTATVVITLITGNITASASSTPGCGAGSATAAASGGTSPYTYSWSPSSQTTQTATGLASGNYTCTITDQNGCTQTATVNVVTYPNPTAAAGGSPTTIGFSETSTLTATGGGNYLWSTGETGATITVSPSATTTYCVLVTDANNCTDSACVTITVDLRCGQVFVPTAFSPNNDGMNDILLVRGNCITEMTFTIYDRWGEKVFETSDPKTGWDGTYKGQALNTAVFVYHLSATVITGEKITMKGNVSLVR